VLSDLIQKSPLVKGLLDFVFPPLCLGCGCFIEEPSCVCRFCLEKIEAYQHPICLGCWQSLPERLRCPICQEDSVPLFVYGGYASPMQEIIIQFKFRGMTLPATQFAPPLYRQFQKQLEALDAAIVIPMPLHPSRERFRGYNQAALFAEQIAELLDLPVREDILFRIKKRKPQAKLELKKRARNIQGVFAVLQDAPEETKVILVDDVVTSGATALEARKVLQQAGYKVAAVVAIAHGQ
jgi:ComF family protein